MKQLHWSFGVIGSVIVGYFAIEKWVISKAETVVDPVKTEVETFQKSMLRHQDRVENELMAIRASQDDLKNILISRQKYR